jgi:hypothetical protein
MAGNPTWLVLVEESHCPANDQSNVDMFHLWSLAEQDLLAERIPYRLCDTGQGLNRVQPAPKTARMMHNILNKAQRSVGSWVGSSVIHVGDHNVPNALMFIGNRQRHLTVHPNSLNAFIVADKYTQIYRILLPICNTLSQIPALAEKPAIRAYIDEEFGSPDNLIRDILGDFFRHGFDGSGADNFFDAGSCIDGRLTSAWNWCALLEKKRYFHVFLLAGERPLFNSASSFVGEIDVDFGAGFMGFDGAW